MHGKACAAENFLSEQKRKYNRGSSCAVFFASSTPAARKYARQKLSDFSDHSLHCLWEFDAEDVRARPPDVGDLPTDAGECSKSNAIISELFHSNAELESYMSEIQLRRIVNKMSNETASQDTDGDEVMQRGGETISKFSKGAPEIGAAVNEAIIEKVREVFDLNKGDDAVYRTKN